MSHQRPGDTIPLQQETEAVIDKRLASAGLPDWVTVDEETKTLYVTGRIHIQVPTDGDFRDQLLRVVGDQNHTGDAFVISNTDIESDTGFSYGVDSVGYVVGGGMDATFAEQDATHIRVVVDSSDPRTRDLLQALVNFDGPKGGLRIEKTGNLLYQDDTGATVFKVDVSDGSVHIKTGTSIVADL